jgi:hypothetical protein
MLLIYSIADNIFSVVKGAHAPLDPFLGDRAIPLCGHMWRGLQQSPENKASGFRAVFFPRMKV